MQGCRDAGMQGCRERERGREREREGERGREREREGEGERERRRGRKQKLHMNILPQVTGVSIVHDEDRMRERAPPRRFRELTTAPANPRPRTRNRPDFSQPHARRGRSSRNRKRKSEDGSLRRRRPQASRQVELESTSAIERRSGRRSRRAQPHQLQVREATDSHPPTRPWRRITPRMP